MRTYGRDYDRIFFTLCGFWFVALALVGFSPSFYFRQSAEPLPTYLIVHGITYSLWVGLFLTQASLISLRRVTLHKALGAFAILLLLIMIPVGFRAVLIGTAAGHKSIDVAGFNLTELVVGFVLAFAGVANRKKPFVHKRLMLFATLMLTIAASDRVATTLGLEEVRIFRKLLAAFPGIALVCYDAYIGRRVPVLSLILLAVVWLIIYLYISDLIFMRPIGEPIIQKLISIFVWKQN